MVTNVTSLGRSGLYDWMVQRFSAIILAAYSLCILANFVMNPDMDFQTWSSIFEGNVMRFFSLITLIALCAHAWIGMWTVSTDYMTSLQLGSSATFFRIVFQAGCVLLIAVYLLWGIQIFWGN